MSSVTLPIKPDVITLDDSDDEPMIIIPKEENITDNKFAPTVESAYMLSPMGFKEILNGIILEEKELGLKAFTSRPNGYNSS